MKTNLDYKNLTLIVEYNPDENHLLLIQLRGNDVFQGFSFKNVPITNLKKISDVFLDLYERNK